MKGKTILTFGGGLLVAFIAVFLALAPVPKAQAATTTINVCAQNAYGGWNLLSYEMTYLRAKLDDSANFGPSGTYGDFDFNYIDIGSTVTEATLLSNACNIWFSGYEADSQYTPTELTELSNWVAHTNGQVFAGCDNSTHDPVCDLLGFTVTNDTDSYGFVVQQLINPITCDGALTPDDQLQMAGGAGAYFTGPGVTPTNVLAVHETGGVADPAKPIIAYTGDFFLTSDIDMVSIYTLTSGGGVTNNNDIMAVNAFSAFADVSVGNDICSSAGPQVADLTITKETNPDGGTGFPFMLEPSAFGFLAKWGSFGTGNGQFYNPTGVAVDGSGNVYVSDTYNHRIQKLAGSGAWQATWGSLGSGNGQFYYPTGMAVDGSGNVYVVDTYNHRIQKFDSSGGWQATWGGYGSGNGQFNYPYGVAVDGSGNIYVSDSNNNRIQKLDSSGAWQATWGGYGSSNGQFYNPTGMAVDGSGNVYVADTNNNRIQKFDSSGVWQATWGSYGSGDGQFNQPYGVAVDGSGNVYVTDYNNHRIQKLDSGGAWQATWGSLGNGDGQFQYPFGAAVDGSGNVYIADSSNYRIQKFGPTGAAVLDDDESHTFSNLAAGSTYTVTETVPVGWTLDDIDCGNATATRDGDAISVTLVAGVDVTCVFTNSRPGSITITKATNPAGGTDFPFVLDPDNSGFLAQWGSAGSGNSQFDQPIGVAVDGAGNVYVADTANHRIQKFDAGGAYLAQWGGPGTGNGQFYNPHGMAIDGSGNIYVADTDNHRVQKFDAGGAYVGQWGILGSGNGQLSSPIGVAVDGDGNVYVADYGNYRIQKFDGNGNYLSQWGGFGSGNGQFNAPYGVAVDGSGNVYVADYNNHRIQMFDGDGTYLTQWGSNGSGNGQFFYPLGAAIDGSGNVYVLDFGNNRIQKFGPRVVTLDDGQSHTFPGLPADDYTVAELVPDGWTLDDIDCGSATATRDGDAISLTLAAGDDVTCVFTNVQYGTITVIKQAGDVGDEFEFDPSWSDDNFTLISGGSLTSDPLPAGTYSVVEVNLPPGWSQQSATCDNTTTTPVETVSPASIPVADGDAWVCTFTNVYTPPPTNICTVPTSPLYTDILGAGMGSPSKHKAQVKLNIPNYTALDSLYGQLVAKNEGNANYVRFYMPGKNNWIQVNSITSPADHAGGNFWYGADILSQGPLNWVKGRWFLQASGARKHIPRALVLYPTYSDPVNTYVNIWNTYDAAEGEAYWDIANGWTPTRVITESIAPPNDMTTFNVELAVVDNDKDGRPVWVTVEAGGVTQTQMPNNPGNGDQLNLMTFTLENVPKGTNTITITIYSPSMALDGVIGDSATLVGMAANYMCAPIK